jgi:hypothetical protein
MLEFVQIKQLDDMAYFEPMQKLDSKKSQAPHKNANKSQTLFIISLVAASQLSPAAGDLVGIHGKVFTAS